LAIIKSKSARLLEKLEKSYTKFSSNLTWKLPPK
jgi:hypothetical protein